MSDADGYLVVDGVVYWLRASRSVYPADGLLVLGGVSYRLIPVTGCEDRRAAEQSAYKRMGAADIERIRAAFALAGIDATNPYHPDHPPKVVPMDWLMMFLGGWTPTHGVDPMMWDAYCAWRRAGGVPVVRPGTDQPTPERTYPPGDPHTPDTGVEG